ncbi:hypothetical protein A9Q99_17430 [Gammaproteobacteria bacterium 45_16_T64]|nr:hypothetical protein A9Q99_17430 [Gammaproteobacteria bacterium 45_16_T64]
MTDPKPTPIPTLLTAADFTGSALTHSEVITAIQQRLDKLYSLTQVTSQAELGGHGHVVRCHLSIVSNSLVGELQILMDELGDLLAVHC